MEKQNIQSYQVKTTLFGKPIKSKLFDYIDFGRAIVGVMIGIGLLLLGYR